MAFRDGIRTAGDLRLRCYCPQDSACWVWKGAKSKNGSGKRTPVALVWYTPAGRSLTLGALICRLLTGQPPAKGVVWHPTCDTPDCANPKHWAAGTQRDVKRRGPSVESQARSLASIRARSKVPDDVAAALPASDEPGVVLADRYGVHPSCISNIRTGKRRGRMGAAGASVFSWRPA